MKKLMCALAAVAAGVAVADVTSANIVGYQNDTMTKNRYTLIGIPFNAMKSDGKGFDFDELNFTGVKDGIGVTDGDVAMFWTGVGWGTQFYHDEDGWWNQDDIEFYKACPEGLPEGTAFFYQSRQTDGAAPNAAVTFAGQVPTAPSKTYTALKNRYTLIANPYPSAYKFDTDVTFTNVMDGIGVTDGDVAMFWTGVGWGEQFYHDVDGWWSQEDIELDIVHPTGFEAGTAFFYQSRRPAAAEEGNVTITFFNPIK